MDFVAFLPSTSQLPLHCTTRCSVPPFCSRHSFARAVASPRRIPANSPISVRYSSSLFAAPLMTSHTTQFKPKLTGVQKLVNRTKKMRFPRRANQFLQMQDDNGFSDGQFMAPPASIPWKSIILAVVLLILGVVGLTIGSLLKVGILASPDWLDKGTPLLILGALCFIPGSYHVGLAYYAYQDYEGYSFSHIPDLDD